MNKNDFSSTILVAIIVSLLLPFLMFWCGYFDGWLFKIFVGNHLTDCINTIFNIDYFTPDMLPKLGGALGFVSGFFKTTHNK